jgi:hypothetical protein
MNAQKRIRPRIRRAIAVSVTQLFHRRETRREPFASPAVCVGRHRILTAKSYKVYWRPLLHWDTEPGF